MKTSAVSRISAEIPNPKKAKFNLSHDVNTTYDWGSVQPLFGKLMLPDSSINVNLEQLTRLAPMVVPTFGRVKLKNIAHFIPVQDIFPNWQALISQTKVSRSSINSSLPSSNTFVPKSVPHLPQNILATFCLVGARLNLYFSGAVGSSDENVWYCARNEGTFASPAGWPAATTAVRALLYDLFNIENSATPTTSFVPDFEYTGYRYWCRRLPLNKNNDMILTTGSAVMMFPTISTLVPAPLDNATGTGFTHSAGNEVNTITWANQDNHITFDGSDMIWEYAGSAGTGITSADRSASGNGPLKGSTTTFFDGRKIRVVFKLSSFGKRLRKILIGLGYDVNLQNSDNVSLLPLMAFYKAYWDSYAPERYKNFYETACWKLINDTLGYSTYTELLTFLNQSGQNDVIHHFREFMSDLGTCFATERLDVISSATDRFYGQTDTTTATSVPGIGTKDIENEISNLIYNQLNIPSVSSGGSIYNPDGSVNSQIDTNNASSVNSTLPTQQISLWLKGPSNLSQPQIDALKKAYAMINKSSVAGMKVEEILRSLGFGDYVEECKGKFINASDEPIKISDVIATASTSDSKLGQYGGRGLGVGNFQFSYDAKQHGFLIVLSSIVPESGYVNGPSVENEAYTFDKLYNPTFDGLAFEAIQKKNLIGSPLINDPTCHDTFGFLPTYTQWKFMSNKANGDFSLNSMKNSLTPYTLDKYIPVDSVGVYKTFTHSTYTGTFVECCNNRFTYSDLPNAGEDWRYINKYPWNGNYNRIFNAVDDGLEWSVYSPNNNAFLFLSFEYDNFMTHNVFSIQYWAHMKPIEDSYGTYDSEHSAPNTTIKKA